MIGKEEILKKRSHRDFVRDLVTLNKIKYFFNIHMFYSI